jgi:hypothetical protein
MRRPTDNDHGTPAGLAEPPGSGVDTGREEEAVRRTQALDVQKHLSGLAMPTVAGEDLAQVPLPEACEVSLDVVGGPDAGQIFRVERSRILIGRGDVEVPLGDRKISRRHASLEVYGASCVLLKDLGSTNGTFVNGARAASAELQDGDVIRLGETTLQVSIGPRPVGARP